jgi:hypothetical protein
LPRRKADLIDVRLAASDLALDCLPRLKLANLIFRLRETDQTKATDQRQKAKSHIRSTSPATWEKCGYRRRDEVSTATWQFRVNDADSIAL